MHRKLSSESLVVLFFIYHHFLKIGKQKHKEIWDQKHRYQVRKNIKI